MIQNRFAAQLLLFLALGGIFDVANAAQPPAAIVLVSTQPGLLAWTPLVESDGTTLVISGPQGMVRTHHFAPGEALILSLVDAQGAPFPDGSYTWELRMMPRRGLSLGPVSEGTRPPVNPLVQSGYFTISNGNLIAPDRQEQPETRQHPGTQGSRGSTMAKDQMVPDDLIVDGKGCVGLGCVNGESFGAEALRLKQSVVRLRFEDTSTQAGFPARDWQLTANDSASGGAERFSLDDLTAGTTPLTILGGAPNNSLFVDATGRLGLGTATPAERFHVFENVDASTFITSENPNTGLNALSAVRAKSDAATVNFQAHSSGRTLSRFGQPLGSWAEFLQVAGNGLLIGTLADKPLILGTNSMNRLHIAANGNVGIGVNPPAAPFHLVGNVPNDAVALIRNTSPTGFSGFSFLNHVGPSGTVAFFFGINNNNFTTRLNSVSNYPLLLMTESAERLRITSAGNISLGCPDPTSRFVIGSSAASCATAPFSSINPGAATFTTTSSRSFKENLNPVAVAGILEKIAAVGVYTYDFVQGPKDRMGLVAEEFHDVFGRGSDKLIEGGEVEMALWLAVQRLTQRNQELAARNEEIQKRLAAIEARLQVTGANSEGSGPALSSER